MYLEKEELNNIVGGHQQPYLMHLQESLGQCMILVMK